VQAGKGLRHEHLDVLLVQVAALVPKERVCQAVGGLDDAGRGDRDDRVAARTKQPKAPVVGRATLIDLDLLRLLLLIRHRVVLCRCPGVVLDRLQEACVRTQQLDRTWVPLQHHTVRLVCERLHHIDRAKAARQLRQADLVAQQHAPE